MANNTQPLCVITGFLMHGFCALSATSTDYARNLQLSDNALQLCIIIIDDAQCLCVMATYRIKKYILATLVAFLENMAKKRKKPLWTPWLVMCSIFLQDATTLVGRRKHLQAFFNQLPPLPLSSTWCKIIKENQWSFFEEQELSALAA